MASIIDQILRIVSNPDAAHSGETRPFAAATSKFEQRAPSRQNDADIFLGQWASDLSEIAPDVVSSGGVPHFGADGRPGQALGALGSDIAPARMRVLELGPLEGAHTYQLEKMGVGEIVAVEANIQAFLKCLIVKNIANLKNANFLLGDFVEYLKQDASRYDLIVCCGVLYHMQDPLELIALMAKRTDRIYVWTHYHSEAVRQRVLHPLEVVRGGQRYIYHQLEYSDAGTGRFWGGNKPVASFLSREDVFRAFRQYGFGEFMLHGEELHHPNGPCLSVSFQRK